MDNVAQHDQLSGVVEINEWVFGRRIKYHVGNPYAGMTIWILGLIERGTNRLLLFPVDDRVGPTLTDIIRLYVAPGTRIFTDGWTGYNQLGAMGYEHFSVIHKHAFRVYYRNIITGEVICCHTNTIEGRWKHTKVRKCSQYEMYFISL